MIDPSQALTDEVESLNYMLDRLAFQGKAFVYLPNWKLQISLSDIISCFNDS